MSLAKRFSPRRSGSPRDDRPRHAWSLLTVTGIALLVVASCATQPSPVIPDWTTTSLDYGQGQLRLGIRVRSVAELDEAGATIHTPEGGAAQVRVFACGRDSREVQRQVREHLRGRLVRQEIADYGRVFALRWLQQDGPEATMVQTAVAVHGPLLIAVSSTNLLLEEVVELARRARLELPVPLIRRCIPLCTDSAPCVAESSAEPG